MVNPDQRKGIVCAARELVAENGFHGTPMSMIADTAEVASGTIYCFFKNKDVLIAEIHQDIVERIYPVLRGDMNREGLPGSAICWSVRRC